LLKRGVLLLWGREEEGESPGRVKNEPISAPRRTMGRKSREKQESGCRAGPTPAAHGLGVAFLLSHPT